MTQTSTPGTAGALAQRDLWRQDTALHWKNERQWAQTEIGKIPFIHPEDLLYGQGRSNTGTEGPREVVKSLLEVFRSHLDMVLSEWL